MHTDALTQLRNVVDTLVEEGPSLFKFHGDVALDLFLHDQLNVDDTVTLCVDRKGLLRFLDLLPHQLDIVFYDTQQQSYTDIQRVKLSEVFNIHLSYMGTLLLNVYAYDIDMDHFVFELNHNFRLKEKHIYFRSLRWGVDYIKPEIVLMYYFLDAQKKERMKQYIHVIDQLSYFQFVMLQTVVGKQQLEAVLRQR